MSAQQRLTALDFDGLLSEQRRLRALVYSRQAESESTRTFLDPDTKQQLRLRPSEWQLLQLERELERRSRDGAGLPRLEHAAALGGAAHSVVPDAAAAASATQQPFTTPAAFPRHSPSERAAGSEPPSFPDSPAPELPSEPPAAHRRRFWLRVALPFVLGIALGAAATLTATGVLSVPGFAVFAPEPDPSSLAAAPLPLPSEHADLLQVFTRGDTRPTTLPPTLVQLFPPGAVAIIYAPSAGNSGTRVYAARADEQQLCLIASIPTQQLAWRCGSLADVARSGLHLRFWLADGLQQPPTTLGDGLDHSPTIADVAWNPDGSFSVTQTPYG